MSAILGLSALGGWFLFFWLYRDYRVDEYRQRLFALRDELWDYAAAGHVSFSDPAYVLVRGRINGLIRFAHLLTLSWFLLGLLSELIRPSEEMYVRFEEELAGALQRVSPEAREQLKASQERALVFSLEHVILNSAIFWVLVVPVVLVALMRLAWITGAGLVNRAPGKRLLDSEAARLGAAA